jgi:outer membrane protein assembly factor BamB
MAHSSKPMFVLFCSSLLLAAAVRGDDWPQWRGPNRDAKVTEFTAPASWPAELTRKWSVAAGASEATPALVGDKLFVVGREGNQEITRCLDLATGNELWKDSVEAPAVTGADNSHPGPRSSPAVFGGKVVTFGVGATLSCLDAATGKVIWRKQAAQEGYAALPRFHTATSPLIVDGLVITHLGNDSAGAVIAYDLATGDQKWKSVGDGPAYASPAVMTVGATKLVLTCSAANILALQATDGKVVWKTACKTQYNAASPLIDGSTVVFAGPAQGQTTAYKIEKSGDAFKGTQLWNAAVGTAYNTPVLKDGFIYALVVGGGGGGGMRRGGGAGTYACLNVANGQVAWNDTANNRNTTYGSIVEAGGVLFGLVENGTLTVFKADPAAFSQLASYKVASKNVYAYPIVSGKNIVVRDVDSVALYTLP